MANRTWPVVLVALMSSAVVSGCLPDVETPRSRAPAEAPPNSPPSITGIPNTAATAGMRWQFTPYAADPDGDALTFTATGLPGWVRLDSQSGELSGTPSESDVGTSSLITVSVSDGQSRSYLSGFMIIVKSAVPPPSVPPDSPSASPSTGAAALNWVPPTRYTDDSILPPTELAGYHIYHGRSQSTLRRVAEVDENTTSFTIKDLSSGPHYFAVTAISDFGTESPLSAIGSKIIP